MLKFKIKHASLFLLFFLMGCVSFHQDDSGVHRRIIQPSGFSPGKKVLIVPFKAGTGVRASDRLDRDSLILLRGIQDGLETCDTGFDVIHNAVTSSGVDIVIEGYIHHFETRDKWMRFFGGSRKRFIDIEGEVINAEGDIIALFTYQDKKRYQDISEMDFLLTAGMEIGRSICPLKEENRRGY